MSVMSVRLSEDLSEQLEALAKATGRTKSFLAGQAIRDFINREAWQIAETQQAIIEADKGDFVSDDEMEARFKKMGVIVNDEN
ncbi:CopG family ribbon-helix-helix protein [Serratia liquefaciens]|uniref:Ribbon-helix-helix protein, CopG family n=1 Tax=Serratia liquefaciens TaxID=614 RepID=A0ABX7D4N7_SERLI|nr:ribbon-helix-helix protein, CopG family [Serratia liquefaciens]MBV0844248.1 ribbon-helix-helix protein, CopG family [Serratia liquefaciens]QQU55281.1 ribbon-helix-helix protein, CopG family [Serratia liquefaciens]